MKQILNLIRESGAADAGAIPYCECEIITPHLEKKLGFEPKSVFIGIVPYYSHFCDKPHSVSAYALAYDYHKLLVEICNNAIEKLRPLYPNSNFAGFADHSPINEKLAAAKCGLGIIGDHSLLITKKYSSFVFLFDIISDIQIELHCQDIKHCEHCGACKKVCPANLNDKKTCVSALTQKKGELTVEEIAIIIKSGFVWGCDLCQLACPHTKRAIANQTIYSDLPWFSNNIIAYPNENTILDSNDFNSRAYSWRGTKTILRNINILNNQSQGAHDD